MGDAVIRRRSVLACWCLDAVRSGRCEGWTSARTHANSEFGGFFLPAEIPTCSFSYGFPENIKHRDQKQPDTACRDHADEDGCTDGMPRDLRCTGGPDERDQSEDERDGCHKHRAKAHRRAERSGISNAQPLLT